MSKEVNVASGTHPDLLDILEKMGHPAYKNWEKRGKPTGPAGVIIFGKGAFFRIDPYNQQG